jgi:uncharacterized protein YutE (UPF0331/DUF86 family)
VNRDKLFLLRRDLDNLDQAATYLATSIERSAKLLGRTDLGPDDLERLEAMASRFARLADLLTQRVMRLVDDLELAPQGSLLDRIARAEKRGWIDDAGGLVRIRELRNLIAHEYAAERMAEIYSGIASMAPELLAIVPRVRAYADSLARRFGA